MAQVKIFGYTDKISVSPGRHSIPCQCRRDRDRRRASGAVDSRRPTSCRPGISSRRRSIARQTAMAVKKQYTQVGVVSGGRRSGARAGAGRQSALCAHIFIPLAGVGLGRRMIGRWDNDKNYGLWPRHQQAGAFWNSGSVKARKSTMCQAEVPLHGAQVWYFVAATLDSQTRPRDSLSGGCWQPLQQLAGQSCAAWTTVRTCRRCCGFRQKHLPEDTIPDGRLARLAREARAFRLADVLRQDRSMWTISIGLETRGARRNQEGARRRLRTGWWPTGTPPRDIPISGIGDSSRTSVRINCMPRATIGRFARRQAGTGPAATIASAWRRRNMAASNFTPTRLIDCNWKATKH